MAAKTEQGLTFNSNRINRAGAIVAAFIALAGAETSAGVAAATPNHDQATLVTKEIPPRLKTIKELPGDGMEVTAEQKEALKASTIKLKTVNKVNRVIYSGCTGVKVTINKEPYIMAAGHCFSFLNPFIDRWINSSELQTEALDFYNPATSSYEFGIHDPTGDTFITVAEIQGVSIPRGRDYALLGIDPNSIVQPPPPDRNWGGGPVPRYFDQIPSLPYRAAFSRPLPGQEVALYSIPDANKDIAVSETGVYLGRTTPKLKRYFDPSWLPPNEVFDIVAIKPTAPENDGCHYGASGSGAILADGHILGPLSKRINLGYGPNHKIYKFDAPLKWQERAWHNTENDLGVRIVDPGFRTLCFYNVPTRETIPTMLKAFGHYK